MASEVTRRNFFGAAGTVAAGAAAGAVMTAASGPSRRGGSPPSRSKSSAFVAAPARARPRPPRCALSGRGQGRRSADRGRARRFGRPEDSRRSGRRRAAGARRARRLSALAAELGDPEVAGIILGTPVYFGNMSSLCKAFLERCIVFPKEKTLTNKVGGVLGRRRRAERRAGTDRSLGAGP